MSRIRSLRKFIPLAVSALTAVFVIGTWAVMTASATTAESAVSTVNLPGVSLAANSSYLSDTYFGVLHLGVGDDTVACASIDSKNRVVVTAVSPGETTVSFWYKKGATDDWVSAVLPISVSGTSSVAHTITSSAVGLVFPQQTASMNAGSDYTISGIALNGVTVNAATLLWISSSDSIATVDRDTGKIHAVAAGTVRIYAIDPTTNSCASETVVVS
ncbi:MULTISPECIES: pilus assembly protein N-terminal domain-containing protein [Acutalibacteraceae]|uniref:pilus assembly protein N-terminal domain-containing protein n=1 Tax=Acutalibacteraceae TaxID=3082771 RepID=UPI0013E8DEC0|nr:MULTISPECIES: pilus assembly protein N-terminal domain-containing protein [Acutalibacteraceae]